MMFMVCLFVFCFMFLVLKICLYISKTRDTFVDMNKPLKLINQGTYGCVFRPNLLCSDKDNHSRKYISKVQLKKQTSANETRIGDVIRKINKYNLHFAPIVETCDVNVSMINDKELKQCDFLQTDDQRNRKYETNKIRYIGANTLVDYFQQEVDNQVGSTLFFKKLLNSYMVLGESIRKLVAANIIHFDLKENNIMCKDKTGRPIIIDFGLSIFADKLNDTPLQDMFFAYAPEYEPWCIDICILSYIANETKSNPDFLSTTVSIENFNPIMSQFIEKSFLKSDLFTPDEQKLFKSNMDTYLRKIIGGGFVLSPTWKSISEALLTHWNTWDNYSLACIYLQLIDDFGVVFYMNNVDATKEFIQLLKKIVLAPPDLRETIDATISQTVQLFKRVDKESFVKLRQSARRVFQTPEQVKLRTHKIMASKQNTVMQEKAVYQ